MLLAAAEQFSAFPLLLTKGPIDLWKPVLKWLQVLGSRVYCWVTDCVQSTFDCYMAPLRVPPYRLAVLAAEWVAMGELLRC